MSNIVNPGVFLVKTRGAFYRRHDRDSGACLIYNYDNSTSEVQLFKHALIGPICSRVILNPCTKTKYLLQARYIFLF